MDVIDNYLDALFSTYPVTARVTEAKAELRAMMEDSYNGALAAGRSHNEAIGQTLSEFGQIDEIAGVLGLSQHEATQQDDFLGASTSTGDSSVGSSLTAHQRARKPAISLNQAQNYADTYRSTRWLLATAIALFVIAPIPLVSLTIASSDPSFIVSTQIATIVGFAILLPLAAVGVGMLVWRYQRLQPFALIREGRGHPTSEVKVFAASVRRENSKTRTFALIVAVALWIVAVFPLIGAGVLTQNMPQFHADKYIAGGVAVAALLVAIGLLVFLPTNWANDVAFRLLDEGLAEARQKHDSSADDNQPTWVRVFYSTYWLVLVAIYLTLSFWLDSWGRTWIIFPVGGVIFAAAAAALGVVYGDTRETQQ